VDVVSSLAGRVADPRRPAGKVRVGGFSGSDGLAAYLSTERTDAVVDATHPFAARMTAHAVQACAQTGVPLLTLDRPRWVPGSGDDWRRVPDLATAAAETSAGPPGTVLLTVGRRGITPFAADAGHHYVIRCVDPPDRGTAMPPRHTLVLARGPFTADVERVLLRAHEITMLVTRDSGGEATSAKLEAARDLGVPVVMIDRPPPPEGVATGSVNDAVRWVCDLAEAGSPSPSVEAGPE
jgi:precorrin-6A/cobalt-precorrin-6A reductase